MADEIQVSAGLDDSPFQEGMNRMDTGAKAFATGFKKEMASIDKVLKTTVSKGVQEFTKLQLSAQRAMAGTGGGGHAAGGTGSSAGYRAGQISLQVQDIAVQLQSGAKATTVIAQQGSQIASIFGSRGAIYGGVIAITAAFIEQISGIKKLEAEVEKAEKKLAEGQAADKSAIGIGQDASENARVMRVKRILGDEASQRLKIALDTREKIDKINASDASEAVKSTAIARIKDEQSEKLAAIDEENKKAFDEWNKRTDDMVQETKKLNTEIDATPVQKIQGLAQAYRDAVDAVSKAQKSGGGEEIVKAQMNAAKARVELGKELKSQNEQAIQDGKRKEAQEEHSKEIVQSILDKATRITDLAEKGLQGLFDQYGLEAQTKELAKQLLTAQQIKTQANIQKADDLLDPAGAKARRRKDQQEKIADRTIAERDLNAREATPGHHRLSPEQRKAEIKAQVARAQAERHKTNKISIEDADITKLANAMMAAAAQQNAK